MDGTKECISFFLNFSLSLSTFYTRSADWRIANNEGFLLCLCVSDARHSRVTDCFASRISGLWEIRVLPIFVPNNVFGSDCFLYRHPATGADTMLSYSIIKVQPSAPSRVSGRQGP